MCLWWQTDSDETFIPSTSSIFFLISISSYSEGEKREGLDETMKVASSLIVATGWNDRWIKPLRIEEGYNTRALGWLTAAPFALRVLFPPRCITCVSLIWCCWCETRLKNSTLWVLSQSFYINSNVSSFLHYGMRKVSSLLGKSSTSKVRSVKKNYHFLTFGHISQLLFVKAGWKTSTLRLSEAHLSVSTKKNPRSWEFAAVRLQFTVFVAKNEQTAVNVSRKQRLFLMIPNF